MNNTGQAVPLSNGVKPTSGLCNKSALRGCVFRKNAGPPALSAEVGQQGPEAPPPLVWGAGSGPHPQDGFEPPLQRRCLRVHLSVVPGHNSHYFTIKTSF